MNWTRTFLLTAAGAIACSANPITFTETLTTNGSLDGTSFTSKLVTITLTGNTSAITNPSSGIFYLNGSASVNVATVGSDTFTDTIAAVANQNIPGAGISDVTTNLAILWTDNAALAAYALSSSVGPITGPSGGNSGLAYATSGGTFSITGALNVDHPSTFSAAVSGVPEPATWTLFCAGMGILTLLKRMIQ